MLHARTQMALVAILTHGDTNGILYGSDGSKFNVTEIREAFTNADSSGDRSNPSHLFGKPKVLIIGACRGGISNKFYHCLYHTYFS